MQNCLTYKIKCHPHNRTIFNAPPNIKEHSVTFSAIIYGFQAARAYVRDIACSENLNSEIGVNQIVPDNGQTDKVGLLKILARWVFAR